MTQDRYINGLLLRKDGYLRLDSANEQVVKRGLLTLNQYKLDKLSLGNPFDNCNNIDFLREVPHLKAIDITTTNFDISPLSQCTMLEEIRIPFNYKGHIDFSAFLKLKSIYLNWNNKSVDTVKNCMLLERLEIDKYNGLSLLEFYNLKHLNYLKLVDPKIISLAGIEKFPYLQDLFIAGAKKLENIEDIENCQKITKIFFHGCKNIEELYPLMYLKDLKILTLNAMGEIPSITFLSPLKNLEEFYLGEGTKVKDGNFNVLQELREKGKLHRIIFTNRKHYSHTCEQLGFKLSAEAAAAVEIIKAMRINKKRTS